MIYLILGLILFLGVHSVRMVADDWRTTQSHASAKVLGRAFTRSRRWRDSY